MIALSQPLLGVDEERAVVRVLRSGHLAMGPEVAAFEAEFAGFMRESGGPSGTEAVAVANGTAALHLALLALGIGPGDEVIVPSLTFIATVNAVRAVGATPVFVDVEPEYFCVDPRGVAAAVTPRTAAIVAVHLYGQPADLPTLTAIAQREGLALVEDAAQAHGAVMNSRPVGSWGTGCFSFYPTKNMTTGEGGLVTTTDAGLATRMRSMRNHGMRRRYEFESFGLNLRMTDLAAAIGRVQLTRLPGWTAERRRNAEYLDARLQSVQVPATRPGALHVYHQYTILSDDRDALSERLDRRSVGHGIYYPTPIHHTPLYAGEWRLPVTERLCRQVLSLPVRPGLTAQHLSAIVRAVDT